MAHKWAKWLPHPCRIGDPHRFRAGGKMRSGPQVGKVATSPLPYRGSPPLQSGGQSQKWPTSGQSGYLTPAVSGDPHRFSAGGKVRSGPQVGKVATSPLPYRGIPTASKRGGKVRSGPQMGKVATSPLPYRGCPPLQSGGQNEKWPTSGQSGYLTPAVSGIPTASERGAKSEVAHKWAKWLPHPCRIGGSPPLQSGGQSQKWHTSGQSGCLTPAVSGIPGASERGGKVRSGPQVGKVAASPLPYRGSPPLQSGWAKSEVAHKWAKWLPHPCRIGDPDRFKAGGQSQKWPTNGQSGYLTPAVSGMPTASERGEKSEVAHKWAKWLPHPCRIGDPHRFRAGGKMRSGPQVGKVATSPLPYRGSPPLQSGGQSQKWPTSGQSGYLTPAVSGDPHRFRAGGKVRSGPQVGKVATSPLPYRGSPPLQSGGQNEKWPTSGQSGYLTPAVSGIPTASERGGKMRSGPQVGKVATSPLPYRGIPIASERGGKVRSGPQVGKAAASPLPYRGSPALQSGGAKSEVAHKWAKWLPHPCRIGDPHRFKAGGQSQKWPTSGQSGYLNPAVSGIPTASKRGGKVRNGPQMGKVATSPLPYRGCPPLQSGGKSQKWHTSGQSGYLTPAVSGIPTASERGAK